MNLFEFIGIIMLVLGIVWGILNAADGRLWAALGGGLSGAVKAFLWFAGFMFTILTALSLGIRYRPPFPR